MSCDQACAICGHAPEEDAAKGILTHLGPARAAARGAAPSLSGRSATAVLVQILSLSGCGVRTLG